MHPDAVTAASWQSGPTAPDAANSYACAQDEASRFYVIAGSTTAGYSTGVRRYDPASNSWTSLAPVPSISDAGAAAYWNGRIYAVDGYGGANRIRIYDIANNSWAEGPVRPGVTNSYGAAAGGFNGKIFVVGGSIGDTYGITAVSIFDIASNSWSSESVPQAPAPYSFGGSTQIGRYLYVVGGLTGSASVNRTTTMRLDMQTKTWTTGPAFTPARTNFGLVASGSKLFAMGGDANGGGYWDDSAAVDELETGNWPGGSWVSSPDPLPSVRMGNRGGFFSIARANGEIWSTAGYGKTEHIYRVAPPIFIAPSPTPTPTPSPTPTPVPSPTPTPIPSPTPTPIPSPTPTPIPSPTPTPVPSPTPTPVPSPTPTPIPSPTPTPVPSPTPTPVPSPTPTPAPSPTPTPVPSPEPSPTATVGPIVTPIPSPSPSSAILLNISTRARVESNDHVLIGGFIIQGKGPKKVVIRARGPSLGLAPFYLPGTLQDPTLELHSGGPIAIATNDNWQNDINASEISSVGLGLEDARESALLVTLAPGAYTAIERGAEGSQGIGLVEVFDLEQNSDSVIANISTRSVVKAGDNVMIGGMIVGGDQAGTFVVRALGPSLNVADPLANPTLELRDNSGTLVAYNDDWTQSDKIDLQAWGLAPTNELESAVVRSLLPGAYTAIVRSLSPDATGVGLVEFYRIP